MLGELFGPMANVVILASSDRGEGVRPRGS